MAYPPCEENGYAKRRIGNTWSHQMLLNVMVLHHGHIDFAHPTVTSVYHRIRNSRHLLALHLLQPNLPPRITRRPDQVRIHHAARNGRTISIKRRGIILKNKVAVEGGHSLLPLGRDAVVQELSRRPVLGDNMEPDILADDLGIAAPSSKPIRALCAARLR